MNNIFEWLIVGQIIIFGLYILYNEGRWSNQNKINKLMATAMTQIASIFSNIQEFQNGVKQVFETITDKVIESKTDGKVH